MAAGQEIPFCSAFECAHGPISECGMCGNDALRAPKVCDWQAFDILESRRF